MLGGLTFRKPGLLPSLSLPYKVFHKFVFSDVIRKKRQSFYRYFSFLVLLLFLVGCSAATTNTLSQKNTPSSDDKTIQTATSSPPSDLVSAIVSKNVDGDTIHVTLNGKDETIRMLLIDTPEDVDPQAPVEPYGYDAANYAKKKLPVGKKIYLEIGKKGSERDKYNRLLAYVYITPKDMYNEDVVRKGLARVAYIYPPNTDHLSLLKKDQTYAKEHQLGIWSLSGYVTSSGYSHSLSCDYASKHHYSTRTCDTSTTKSSNTLSQKKDASATNETGTSKTTTPAKNNTSDDRQTNVSCKGKIKGNKNSKIYHVPGGAFYDSTQDNIVWFCSEADAEKAGYRKSKR
ncbi:micrococcal nuclease [Pullulanibacillus pueri]|nr:thermonuclease family protein [Pullulanibacillus pueri]MBM7683086.1 micrococcal nuclease [Pullulanibacillus pueri]